MAGRTQLTPVLSRFWDDPKSWTFETYREHDGYRALATALNMTPDEVLQTVKESGPKRDALKRKGATGTESKVRDRKNASLAALKAARRAARK